MRASLDNLIRSVGFRAQAFPSAESFLSASPELDTACFILDVRMPGRSGLDLRQQPGLGRSEHAVRRLPARRKVEAKPVDVHVLHPVPQAVEHHAPDDRLVGVERVAGAGVVGVARTPAIYLFMDRFSSRRRAASNVR